MVVTLGESGTLISGRYFDSDDDVVAAVDAFWRSTSTNKGSVFSMTAGLTL